MPPSRSPTNFNAKAAARLERMYASPQVVGQRAAFRRLLAARAGEAGVDVGCGLGHLTCELAADVAPGGKIAALDSSEHMVGEATARVAAAGLGAQIAVQHGDATAIDIADDSVDFVVAVQVYSYVPEVARAVAEAARVLRPGGRLAVLETDWDLCVFESADRDLGRRILEAQCSRFAHPRLPRQLHRLLRAAGLTLSACDAYPIVETRYDPDSFGASLLPVIREPAIRSGVDAADVERWIADVRSRTGDGEYFFSTNRFIFIARR
jgi:ubiquinone/menaquinone biosynthesis C-methylase UbiE